MTTNDIDANRHPDRSIDDKFERVVAERDDLAGALVEAERERDRAEAELDTAVASLRDVLAELKDRTAEARGARSDYEELKGVNADTARERDELRAELDRVRADLAAAHNHAHRQDTNLQQIVRAKDEIAAERDALKAAAEPLLEHIDLIRAHWAVLLPRDVGETLLARGAALAVLLPNTQEPCDICSGYGCPDCREDLSGVSR